MLLANFRSIVPKLDTVKGIIFTCSPDIILGTETWLTPDVTNSELSLPVDLTVFRKDRKEGRGGGVMIAIRSDYQPCPVAFETCLELLWVMVRLKGVTYIIGACYRPPNSLPDFVDHLQDALEYIFATYPPSIVLLGGDFNYSAINWKTSSVTSGSNRHECSRLLDTMTAFHLTQLVQEPTRGDHVLDLLFTNLPTHSRTYVLEEISDHRFVHSLVPMYVPAKHITSKCILNYPKCDHENINRMLRDFANIFKPHL